MPARMVDTRSLAQLPVKNLRRCPMKEFLSLRVGGEADMVFFPENLDELRAVASAARKSGVPLYTLGGGTNLLVRDHGVRGAMVSLYRGFNYIATESGAGDQVLLRAGAGVSLARACLYALSHGLEGLEGLMGIPGSLGGCLTMNAGTNRASVGERVNTVSILAEGGEIISFHRREIDFGYRSARYPSSGIIVEAQLVLKKNEAEELRRRALETVGRRSSSRHVPPFNAGSIFKNPPGYTAGALVEECGLKGAHQGGAQISRLHGNIIVNRGWATAADVLKLMERAREAVLSRLGIELEEEIRVIGE